MQLSQATEADVLEVYETWLNSYLNGDVKTYDSFLDDEYRFIGSTDNEDYINREDTTKFFEATAAQFAGKTDIRNNARTVKQFGDLIFVTDLFDAWFLSDDEWSFYGKFRFTSALRKNSEGWRFVYQHFSMPDSKAEEGQTIGYDRISAENLQLREAVNRRTKELNQKNRALEIEAALERVRARTMAMHHSREMQQIANVMYEQMIGLGLEMDALGMSGVIEAGSDYEVWVGGSEFDKPLLIPYSNSTQVQREYNHVIEKRPEIFAKTFSGEVKKEYIDFLLSENDFPNELKQLMINSKAFSTSIACARNSSIQIARYTGTPYSDEENEILKRFSRVFEQAYIRFMDLQKAEAQTRTAQIETSLERVRSRSMAMQQSDELNDVLSVLFQQFDVLGIKPVTAFLSLFDIEKNTFTYRSTSKAGNRMQTQQVVDMDSLDVWKNLSEKWKNDKQDSIEVIFYPTEVLGNLFELLKETFQAMPETERITKADFPNGGYAVHGYCKFGYIGYNHVRPPSDEEKDILIRFAQEFGRVYQRFLDIEKAETLAREAVKQAALDRVRGQIASMRSTDDLKRITPLIFKELTTLGVPLIRCGVFIIDDSAAKIEAHLSAPDGQTLGVLSLPFNTNALTTKAVQAWRSNTTYHEHWNEEDFNSWAMSMLEAEQIENLQIYQGEQAPPESLELHFIPFRQGMLYVGNVTQLSEEEVDLARALAEAFSIAYARYEDFVRLAAAKANIEAALAELKATQSQLIHSEKMASLGELTAGIAHEIQNPLNFVNNFSEVSQELLEEMHEELDSGNHDDVREILKDVTANLDKIHHHGKRAAGIVKGMLQHSRQSTGIKEEVKFNSLVDEYLRLAYHGIRAKDSSFNISVESDFDKSIDKVNIIPQDIGRVILNLVTNAFYACTHKKLTESNSTEGNSAHHPLVIVTTRKLSDHVHVTIRDNGDGIPQKDIDKIFQPFFTTKPTGEGTGLGLSLAYDIITKGHAGTLSVKSEEGVFTEFTFSIPI